jgi:hypothetical protein
MIVAAIARMGSIPAASTEADLQHWLQVGFFIALAAILRLRQTAKNAL